MRFRQGEFAVMANIKQMYNQVILCDIFGEITHQISMQISAR